MMFQFQNESQNIVFAQKQLIKTTLSFAIFNPLLRRKEQYAAYYMHALLNPSAFSQTFLNVEINDGL